MSNSGMCKWFDFQGVCEQVWEWQDLLVHNDNGPFFVSDFKGLVAVSWDITPCIFGVCQI
jgi:hypothetical protein